MKPQVLGAVISGRLDGIQILRFVAALLVLVQHAVFLPSISYSLDVMPFRRMALGTAGVFIFFVISGYVIARLIDQPPLRFALHRALRIYIPYTIAVLLGLWIMVATGKLNADAIVWRWSYTLLPLGGGVDSFSQVPFWTLIYEMLFYLVTFGLMFGGRKAFDIGIVLWAILIVGLNLYTPYAKPVVNANWWALLTSPICLLFIAGASLSRFHQGTTWPMAAIALIVFFPMFWRPSGLVQSYMNFGVGAVAATHFAVVASGWVSKRKWTIPLVRGGDWSYGLYLLHAPIIAGLLAAIKFPSLMSYWLACAVMILAGGAGALSFGWLEFWFYNSVARPWADKFFKRASQKYCPPEADAPALSPGKYVAPAPPV